MKENNQKEILEILKNGKILAQNTKYFMIGHDTLLLENFIEIPINGHYNILDIGTGSGVLPLLLSNNENTKIYGIEIQKELSSLAQKNIEINNLKNKCKIINEDIKKYKSDIKYDIIITNPPYYKLKNGNLPKNKYLSVAKHEISLSLKDLIISVKRNIKNFGEFYMIYPSDRLLETLKFLEINKLYIEKIQFIYSKKYNESILFLVKAINGKKKKLKIKNPIFI